MGKTYAVVLKRVSDGLTIQGVLADGKAQRGGQAYSADTPGKAGRVVIESFHKGSGQRNVFQLTTFDRNYKYNSAVGWDATRAGHVRSVPTPAAPVVLTNTYPLAGDQGRAEIFQHPDAGEIIITSRQIYEGGVLKDTVAANNRFTGGYAIFGDRTFFGVENATGATTDRASKATCRVRTGTAVGVYADTNFPASYFAVVGSHLFRVVQNAAYPKVAATWTDTTGTSTPGWFTLYTYPTEQFAMDAANLRGAFVIAIGGVPNMPGEVVTMDTAGNFTNIIPVGVGFSAGLRFLSYNGGQIFLVAGSIAESLYFDDVSTVSPLGLHPVTDQEGLLTSLQNQTYGTAALLAASTLDTAIIGMHLGGTPVSAVYVAADTETGRPAGHSTPLPPTYVGDTDTVLAARFITADASGAGARTLKVLYLTTVGGLKQGLQTVTIPFFNGNIPAVPTANVATGDFTTSEYLGASYGLKQFMAISGRAETLLLTNISPPIGAGLVFKLHIIKADGTETVITLPALNAAGNNLGGPFHFELADTAIGRTFYLTWSFIDTDQAICDILCPLVVDYIEIPNQRSVAVLPLLIGSLNITRTGTFTKQDRLTVMNNIEAALLDPSEWTMEWWDDVTGQPSWTCLIESFKAQELSESDAHDEAAIATLTVRRLNTTARAI